MTCGGVEHRRFLLMPHGKQPIQQSIIADAHRDCGVPTEDNQAPETGLVSCIYDHDAFCNEGIFIADVGKYQHQRGADFMADIEGSRVDRSRLEEIGMGDTEFTRDIIQMMIEDGRERIRLIREAYKEQTWETVGREAHSLKGAALNVGANSLAELCASIDNTVRKLKTTIEESMLDEVESEFELVKNELTAIVSELNS
ncbi:Hpt domain-containing protein [bacterium]|nr:Hpt domain-containing protein [bacterium]MBU1919626.1 Hpt domain-containing protein [bacterium]